MKKFNFLKSKNPFAILLLVSVLSMASCSKDDGNSNNETAVMEDDAVEVIESSLAKETNGMTKTVETTIETADAELLFTEEPTIECGQMYNDSYSETYSKGNYSYNYAVSRDYLLSCNEEGNPESFSYSLDFNGVYDTPRMSSNDSTTVEWSITNLETTETSSTFNGSYLREGTQVSKVRNKNTFNSTLTIDLSDLIVNKSTYTILSGTAQVAFVGLSSNGNQYTFNGTLTFNGDETATLILNGNTYIINL